MGTQKCIFAQKVCFGAQNAFWDPKCIFEPKSRFEQIFHFFGSDRARWRKKVRVCEFVRVPKCTFCSKSHFWPKSHFLRQKCILGPKCTFGPKKWFWSKRCIFCDLDQNWLHLAFVLIGFGAKCRNDEFCVEISKKVEIVRKRFLTAHNSENFSEFSQKSLFRHVVFYYSGAEKSVPFGTLFAREHFGAKNAFWGPKMYFGLRCIFGSKNAFWGPFCPLAADAYETNGFCIGF